MARSLKRHLLDIRQQALFERMQTRCGLFKRGQKEGKLGRGRCIKWVEDWDERVDVLPEEGKDYCGLCLKVFKRDGGQADYEEYKDRISGETSVQGP